MRVVLQQVTNVALNAPPAWSIHNTDLTVADGIDTYTLVADDFGKPILIETVNAGDAYHVPRPIAISSLESILLSNAPGSSGEDIDGNGVSHSAQAIAVYRDSGSVKLRVLPVPASAATYRIYYEIASPNDDSLDNLGIVPAGDAFIVSATALGLLPHCKWALLDEAQCSRKRSEIAKILGPMTALLERQWKIYLMTDKQSGRITLPGFADDNYIADQNG